MYTSTKAKDKAQVGSLGQGCVMVSMGWLDSSTAFLCPEQVTKPHL